MSSQLNPDEIKRLVEIEFDTATYIPLRTVLVPHLIEPFVRMLTWPYSQHQVEYPCWIVADLGSHFPGMTIGYSAHGHGSHGDPWGIVLNTDAWFGRDDSWFKSLEDAYINSGAWMQPLPPEYEIR